MKFFSEEHRRAADENRHTLPEKLEKTDHPDLYTEVGKMHGLKEVWVSRYFALRVIEHTDYDGRICERLVISKTTFNEDGTGWEGDIAWDELQELKSQCGRGDRLAIEVFPKDENIVRKGNYRHLWVLPESLPYVWASKRENLSPAYDKKSTSILETPSWLK